MHCSVMASHPAFHVLSCLFCAGVAAQTLCFADCLLRYDVQHGNPTHKCALYCSFSCHLTCSSHNGTLPTSQSSNAGTVPFKDPSIMGLYDVIRTQPITFRHKPAVSAGLKDLISRMLCKDPCQRITLPQVMTHRWTTHNSSMPLQCRQVFAQLHDCL